MSTTWFHKNCIGYWPLGRGSGKIWVEDMACKGIESSLHSCRHREWGVHDCGDDHDEDVGVVCSGYNDLKVKLVGGTEQNNEFEGRVEVNLAGNPGTLCDNGWNIKASDVTCKMLGHEKAVKTQKFAPAPDSQTIWLQDVKCFGCEKSLMECSHSNWETDPNKCSHRNDVGVICLPKSKFNVTVSVEDRLVKVTYHGVEREICADDWDIRDADVICRMATASKSVKAAVAYNKTGQSDRVWLSNLNCFGNESTIEECKGFNWNWENKPCGSGNLRAAVICQESEKKLLEFHIGDKDKAAGPLEVVYHGHRGNVCASNLNLNDAHVLCRELKYEKAIIVSPWAKDKSSKLAFAISMKCSGSEAHSKNCNNLVIRQTVRCNNSDIIGLVCQKKKGHSRTKYNVQLVKGSKNSEGRVVIERYGVSGTICGDGWDMRDANVVCRMKGFAGAITAYKNFGEGSGPVWFTGLDCKGNEENINGCYKKIEKTMMCNHSRDAGVVCYSKNEIKGQLQVNLTSNASSHYGRVQIIFNNTSRTVCGDQDWDINDAHVVCRMLGFPRALAAIRQYKERSGSGPSISRVRCNGNEKTFELCDHAGWDQPIAICNNKFDAGVICERSNVKDRRIKVSMANKTSDGTYLVEIEYQGVTGIICSKGWKLPDAHVVCRSAPNSKKYQTAVIAVYPRKVSKPILLNGLGCVGNENGVGGCQHSQIGNTDCDVSAPAAVFCGNLKEDEKQRFPIIKYGKEQPIGHVEVKYVHENITKPVCDENWDINDARVICEIHHKSQALAAVRRFKKDVSTKKWLVGLECRGDEKLVAECLSSSTDHCPGGFLAGILCKNANLPDKNEIQVRLKDGDTPNSGRLEVRFWNIWGTVCDDGLEITDVHVACRMLGYIGAEGFLTKMKLKPGSDDQIIWLSNISCNGVEKSIDECKHPGWGQHRCDHTKDVGVICKRAEAPIFEVDAGSEGMTESTATIRFYAIETSKHLESIFQIAVEKREFEERLRSHGFEKKPFDFIEINATMAEEIGNNSYIAAEIKNPKNITIGDGLYYNGYYNAPLDSNTAYRVYVRVITMTRDKKKIYGDSSYIAFTTNSPVPKAELQRPAEPDGDGTVVGLSMIIVILVGVLIGVSVWYVLKQRKEQKETVAKMQALEMSRHGNTQDNAADDYYQAPNAVRQEQNEYIATTEDERKALQALLVQKKTGGVNRRQAEIPTYVDIRS